MEWAHTIKTKELWRQTEAKSFSQFCEMQDWTPRRFNQLASGYAVLLTIPKEVGKIFPTDSTSRELGKAPEKRRTVIADKIKQSGKPVTIKAVKEAVKKDAEEYEPTEPAALSGPKEKEVIRDKTGVALTPIALEYWNRSPEVQEALTIISKLKTKIEKARESQDPLWVGVSQHVISELELCYSYIKDAMPYSLCTICNGWPKETKCSYCGTMGILSKTRYMGTDDRIRAIREKAHAQFLSA